MNFGNINNFNPRTFSSNQGRGLETGCAGAYTAGPICKPVKDETQTNELTRQGRGLETGCAGAYTAGPICKPASKDNILDVHLADASAADVYKGMTADDVIKIKNFKI